ncbi:MAG: glycosyltransferase family 9 protein, partial [Thermomicrobiaceae bacterium]|nr:glycosyltransferase family 9 protein [Thermomicrobiaceae bacterium]
MADAATHPIGSPARILVVRLADLGDALLATPAVHALRETFPSARIDVLAAPSGAEVFDLCPAVDRVVRFPKRLFDQPAGLARPANAWLLARLAASLRLARYDAVVLLHHLTTRFGARKFRALCLATGAPIRAGLDNGWGTFLTHRALDLGFGARPEWRYALDVAAALGAHTADTRPRLAVPNAAREAARDLLASRGVAGEYVVIHPAVGGYSPARAWPRERFAEVARRLRREAEGTRHVVVG